MIVDNLHESVLKKEAIEGLSIKPGKRYIDATIGSGGHAEEILKRGGIVLGIDQDHLAIEHCHKRLFDYVLEKKLTLVKDNFENIVSIAKENNFGSVSGILYDLGISSVELKDPKRGFSFKNLNSPLDMRLSEKLAVTAFNLLNALNERELLRIFRQYGQIKLSKKLVLEIIKCRKQKKFYFVSDFTNIFSRLPYESDILPKAFLALRIAVNSELSLLEKSVNDAVKILGEKGRLLIISFQSLEDKIVKKLQDNPHLLTLSAKPQVPGLEEIKTNPRSRSAKLRIYEKK
jgi:16S rRNA (cytosine1402-N4)-methyltransferase